MSGPRALFVLSSDYGEYVTANLFSRGQPFARHFALPAALAGAVGAQAPEVSVYSGVEDLEAIVARQQPHLVVLASGYLFAVNGLIAPDDLARFISRLRAREIAVATTDPWLRIWKLRRGARFTIHSVRRGAEDEARSRVMNQLRERLERDLASLPHLYAVPLPAESGRAYSFFNPRFAAAAAAPAAREYDDWLFVLSREDLAYLPSQSFLPALLGRIEEILARPRNRVTLIGPQALQSALGAQVADRPRLRLSAGMDFAGFEAAVRSASIVAYWNVLSASLLYCLYYGVPPIFFGRGHQARVCEGLFEHAAEYVYRGRAPRVLDLAATIEPDPGALARQLGLPSWLENLRAEYARAASPNALIERVLAQPAR
jgi:hypothetical protein